MTTSRTYLDYNASAPLRPEAEAAMAEAMAMAGNASSVHAEGRRLRALVDRARDSVADAVGARPGGVVFTAGATEANNLALGFGRERRAIVSAIEHDSVLQPASESAGVSVAADPDGVVDLAALERALAAADGPALVSLMLVNNETGVIQPVAEAAAICRAYGALLHCDAVQALGRMPVDMAALGADMVSLSAHKIGGPQGVGALVLAEGVAPPPHTLGGGQEGGRRAGTLNAAGIAGFAAAIEAALRDAAQQERLAAWRDAMEGALVAAEPQVRVIGAGSARVAGVSCLAMPGFAAETAIMALDLAGFAVGAGSACSSGKIGRSHVLQAMGLPADVARCAIRVSGGWATGPDDMARFADAWLAAARRARRAA
ncbi:MAG: cysteine desulfurase family protein [Alphaproteobacteria bacterium]